MREHRLKTDIIVSALLRRAQAAGAFAVVARKGDADAGALAVKVFIGAGEGRLFVQSRDLDGAKVWRNPLSTSDLTENNDAKDGLDDQTRSPEPEIDAYLARETKIDPDLWIVEIDDRDGRHFLDDD